MPDNAFFKAPWGKTLRTLTGLTCLLLLGIVLLGLFTGPSAEMVWVTLMVLMPLGILATSALFTVRGYTLTQQTLQIQRLMWANAMSLADLQSAHVEPKAMNNSLRLWGNGGLFAFTGYFRNQKLGRYQAFATDLEQTVVLTFPNRKIVLSPHSPDEFVNSILKRCSDE
ncbi:MAG: hypothetical protein F6J95_011990 [Leptolyngbya sp. SIO1E4]|nr:hypothetical protein [Leptolyngbya sp. SIO1E4]